MFNTELGSLILPLQVSNRTTTMYMPMNELKKDSATYPALPSSTSGDVQRALELRSDSMSENTRRSYRTAGRQFAEYCQTHGMKPELSVDQLLAWIGHMDIDGKSDRTITARVYAVSRLAEIAELGSPARSPRVKEALVGLARQHAERKAQRSRPILRRDVIALAQHARIPRDLAILLLGFQSGMRRSEIVGLNWDDLEFSDAGVMIMLRKSKTDQTGRGRRIAIHRGQPGLCAVEALMSILPRHDTGPVFRNRFNDRLSAGRISFILKQMAEDAGMDPTEISAHGLRGGMITQAAMNGASTMAIRAKTGHKSDRTMERYIEVADAFEFAQSASVL